MHLPNIVSCNFLDLKTADAYAAEIIREAKRTPTLVSLCMGYQETQLSRLIP